MKKILLIPDSFKGTMSSATICSIMAQSVKKYFPQAQVSEIPVADGGEGSVDAFLSAVGGEKVYVKVKGPYGDDVMGFYGLLPDKTAVIEMAAAAGLPLAGNRREVGKATTYGVGQLILHAVKSGCGKIILGLGGSATNDGGAGAAAALGVRFTDKNGRAFIPVGDNLDKIAAIDKSRMNPCLKNISFTSMCDIDNPLCGPDGAAAVFGPQKGAGSGEVKRLDANLFHFADIIRRDCGSDILSFPGAGAAGGMGGGMSALIGSKLQMGIETVLETVNFDGMLDGADLIFSGEGRIDAQSLRGKVVIGVARHAKRKKVPLIAVVGDIGDNIDPVYSEGVSAVFSINRTALPYEKARLRNESDLRLTMEDIMRLLKTFGGIA